MTEIMALLNRRRGIRIRTSRNIAAPTSNPSEGGEGGGGGGGDESSGSYTVERIRVYTPSSFMSMFLSPQGSNSNQASAAQPPAETSAADSAETTAETEPSATLATAAEPTATATTTASSMSEPSVATPSTPEHNCNTLSSAKSEATGSLSAPQGQSVSTESPNDTDEGLHEATSKGQVASPLPPSPLLSIPLQPEIVEGESGAGGKIMAGPAATEAIAAAAVGGKGVASVLPPVSDNLPPSQRLAGRVDDGGGGSTSQEVSCTELREDNCARTPGPQEDGEGATALNCDPSLVSLPSKMDTGGSETQGCPDGKFPPSPSILSKTTTKLCSEETVGADEHSQEQAIHSMLEGVMDLEVD